MPNLFYALRAPQLRLLHMKDKRGFSLIAFILIGALTSILMQGIMHMVVNLSSAQKSIGQSTEFDNLVLLIKMALQNPLTCAAALQDSSGVQVSPPASLTAAAPDLPANGISVSKISIGTLLVDTSVPYNGMDIQAILLKQVVVGSPDSASPFPYTTNLHIQGSKAKPGGKIAVGGGNLSGQIPISLSIQIPGGGGPVSITECSTSESTSTPSAWVAPTLTHGWTNYPGFGLSAVGYRKNAVGLVEVRGTVKDGACNGVPIFTLPLGFRPTSGGVRSFSIYNTGEAKAVRVDVSPFNGQVRLPHPCTNVNQVHLDGIIFSTK